MGPPYLEIYPVVEENGVILGLIACFFKALSHRSKPNILALINLTFSSKKNRRAIEDSSFQCFENKELSF